MSEHNIMPGIYRVGLGSHCRPPGEESFQRYKKWHEEHDRKVDTKRYSELRSVDDVLKDALRDHKLFLADRIIGFKEGYMNPYFFETPLSFFISWIDGYSAINERKRGGKLDPLVKGFELQYATWNEGDPYFQISYQKRFKNPKTGKEEVSNHVWSGLDETGRMNIGIVLATDLNGIIDINGYMALAVNDLDAKRVYSYKPKEETSEKNQDRWREKTLLAGEDPYVWADITDEPEFPFESLASTKTKPHTWTSIGFTPHEVFNALRQLGFKFPTDSAR